jgi:hypothetical protein
VTATQPQRSPKLARCLVFLAVAITVTAAAACGDRPGDTVNKDANRQQQIQELLKRPDIDKAVARYEQMRTEIRDRLTAEVELPPWKARDGTRAGCREFPDVDGMEKQSAQLGTWSTKASLPDDNWPRAVEIFAEVTRSYGFESPPRVIVDRPGNHEVTAADEFGADVILGTEVNTTLSLLTGCHPTWTGRQRHTPTTP